MEDSIYCGKFMSSSLTPVVKFILSSLTRAELDTKMVELGLALGDKGLCASDSIGDGSLSFQN